MALSCAKEDLDLMFGKKFFMEVVKHWNRLSRRVVESTPLAALKKHVSVAFGDVIRLVAGPKDLRRLFKP